MVKVVQLINLRRSKFSSCFHNYFVSLTEIPGVPKGQKATEHDRKQAIVAIPPPHLFPDFSNIPGLKGFSTFKNDSVDSIIPSVDSRLIKSKFELVVSLVTEKQIFCFRTPGIKIPITFCANPIKAHPDKTPNNWKPSLVKSLDWNFALAKGDGKGFQYQVEEIKSVESRNDLAKLEEKPIVKSEERKFKSFNRL